MLLVASSIIQESRSTQICSSGCSFALQQADIANQARVFVYIASNMHDELSATKSCQFASSYMYLLPDLFITAKSS